jgi:hypothetical protein
MQPATLCHDAARIRTGYASCGLWKTITPSTMKSHLTLLSSLFLLLPFVPRWANGQDETRPPAADGSDPVKEEQTGEVSVATGTIFSLDATSISLTPEKSSIPLVFETTNATPLVDELDKKVAKDLVLTGIGATVHYVTVGEKLIASKIVVTRKSLAGSGSADPAAATRKRAELTETKVMKDEAARSKALAVEGGGTLMGFEQIIAVRAAGDAAMTQYTVTNSTLFVDSAGNPVPPHVVRTGVGLKVQFVEDAGRKIATRVTVHSMPAWVREGLMAAETGTTVRGPAAPATATALGQQTTAGSLADGFIYQPVLSLPTGQVTGTVPSNTDIQPGTVQPGTTQPNSSQPGTSQPGATQPGPNQPNTNQPGTTQPGSSQPGTSRPNTAPPSTSQPGTGPRNVSTPRTITPLRSSTLSRPTALRVR